MGNAKLKMEDNAKSGWILMAKARYVSPGGPTSISKLQLPSEESDKEVVASKKVITEECIQEGTKVRYFHHSFEEKPAPLPVPDSGVKQRKNVEKKNVTGDNTDNAAKTTKPSKMAWSSDSSCFKTSTVPFRECYRDCYRLCQYSE